jgi:alpha,alpha-trehalase
LIRDAQTILRYHDHGTYTVPAEGIYPASWLWDAGFCALGWATIDQARAWVEISTIIQGQWDDGMLPHIVFHSPDPAYFPGPNDWGTGHVPATSGITQPPVLATVVRRLVASSDPQSAKDRLSAFFDSLLANHRWWHTSRDPDSTGLVVSVHPWETGMDNSPAWDEVMATITPTPLPPHRRRDLDSVAAEDRPTGYDYDRYWSLVRQGRSVNWDSARMATGSEFRVADPLTNILLARADHDMVALAELVSAPRAVVTELEHYAKLSSQGLDRLWDSSSGHYRAKNLANSRFIGPPTVASLCAPFAPGIPPQRVAHLARQAHHWATLAATALPSVDPSFGGYDPTRYWRGPVWVNTNWIAAVGFAESGHNETADRIAAGTVELVARSGFAEYFDPATGEPHGARRFSWSAALALAWLVPGEMSDVLSYVH